MREAYEAWFKERFGFPPMPIHSRTVDFCWEGYQAGAGTMRNKPLDLEVSTKGASMYRIEIVPDD